MKAKRIIAADLFCGAGGSSTGLGRAAEALGRRVELTAVNHWERAIETHAANHPRAAHFCQSLADLDPKRAIPGGRLDLLVASPECTHHSVARGGKPVNDQSRATAYCVHRWCAALDVRRVLIENVPEFQTWGPIGADGKPTKSGRAKLFEAYIQTFRAMGYRVEWRVLNAADYGAATSRRRLFVQCAKGRLPIRWPEPTHQPNPQPGLFETLPRWRAAREIIDWTRRGLSIFGRTRPLSPNTLKRIEAGLRRFGGAFAPPFLLAMNYMSSRDHDARYTRGVGEPIPTITSQGNRFALVEPFLMSFNGAPDEERRRHDLARPLPTQHCANRFGLVEPFVMHTTHQGGDRVHGTADPLPCVTGANRGEQALVEPFILPHRQFDGMQVDDIGNPLRTVTATNGGCNALVQPFITPFYANGQADPVTDPLRTVTTRDRFAVVEPTTGPRLDILFRMLQPDELAAAMGFPAGYRIAGNRGEQVKQIGNAVEVNQAAALCRAMLEDAA